MDEIAGTCPSCTGYISRFTMDRKLYGICAKCRHTVCQGCILVAFQGRRPGSLCRKCNADEMDAITGPVWLRYRRPD